jgi:hypothetical protein
MFEGVFGFHTPLAVCEVPCTKRVRSNVTITRAAVGSCPGSKETEFCRLLERGTGTL